MAAHKLVGFAVIFFATTVHSKDIPITESCVNNWMCVLGYGQGAYCDNTNHCACDWSTQHLIMHHCYTISPLGGPCVSDNNCFTDKYPERVQCAANNTCVCKSGYAPSEDHTYCSGCGLLAFPVTVLSSFAVFLAHRKI